jgi:hypothetical protein
MDVNAISGYNAQCVVDISGAPAPCPAPLPLSPAGVELGWLHVAVQAVHCPIHRMQWNPVEF